MNFICQLCGTQLGVERGVDEDRVFEAVWRRHAFTECPRRFTEEPDGRLRPQPGLQTQEN